MTPAAPAFLAQEDVPPERIEQELTRQLSEIEALDELSARRVHMSNLVVFCDRADLAEAVAAEVPAVVRVHPARVLLLIGEPGPESTGAAASVHTWCQSRGRLHLCSEQVTLRARGRGVEQLPYLVRGLLVGDLPTNLWWASRQPPSLAGPLLHELAEHAQQIIYDSLGWAEPARGVAAVAAWLERFERGPGQGRWRVASDLNWRRLKFWRRLLTQALDPATAPGAAASITEVRVEHGPHAVVQAWELVSWLASRLGWRVRAGRVEPGVEITWHFDAGRGPVRVQLHRLADGPSALRRLRVACSLDGKLGALNAVAEDERRLSVFPEGSDAAPRTVLVQPLPTADLVGRQLSDRERDPVFCESMAVAQVLAQSVLP